MEASKATQKAKDKLNKVPATLTHQKSSGIASILQAYQAQIAQALPRHVPPARVIQMSTTLISRTPALKECTTESIIGGVMSAAILGLDLTPQLGQAFLVPFKNSKSGNKEAQFIIGYKGMLELFRRTGNIETVYAYVVRENDEFDYELGLEPFLKHKPSDGDRGKMVRVYAVAKFKDGGYSFEVLSKADVLSAKSRSKASGSSSSPWNGPETDQEMMWRKTAIRRIANFMPLSVEIQKVLHGDEEVLKPEMYDKDGLNLMEIEPAEVVDDTPETDEAPKETKQPDTPKAKPPEDKWLSNANGIRDKIIFHSDKETFLNELGDIGFESLEQVPPADQPKVMDAMVKLVNELILHKNKK